ncbi:MAG: ferrous iron transport protein A [bacterium]|nr:ferrous iron transport protein A [bacterium]
MNLSEVRVGNTVRVLKLNGTGPVRRRIMDMGITKGQEIYVRKVAPLGDPMEVTVRKYELSVRKADCKMIEVEPVEPADEAEDAAVAEAPAAAEEGE